MGFGKKIKAKSFLTLLFVLLGCLGLPGGLAAEAYRPDVPLGVDWSQAQIPRENPLSQAKVDLGRRLFYDGRLLGDATCSLCHVPELAFTGGPALEREAPTLLNRAFSTLQFWDGRASSLEEVVLLEILTGVEDVRQEGWKLLPSLRHAYEDPFEKAFGSKEITYRRAALAIAAFVRTLLSGSSAWDRFEYGHEEGALSPEAKRGLTLFRGKARCYLCHRGFNFTDEAFHNLGVGWDPKRGTFKDPGRFAWTGKDKDRGAFKTPTLRDLTRTAPYMHDGSLRTLEEVVDFYNQGGNPNPYLDPTVRPLNLSGQEKEDLLAFLRALDGDWYGKRRYLPPE